MEMRGLFLTVVAGFLAAACWSSALAAAGEVESGLAAKYPADAGIAKDPAVVYASGYEDETWKEGWECSQWGLYSLTNDPAIVFSGKGSLQKRGPEGGNGASLTYDLKKPVDVLYQRAYFRFAAGTDNVRMMGISGVAAGMPQWKAMGSAGVRPTELPYFCATLVTQDENPLAPMWYPYHIDQKGPWGDNWPINATFPADKWVCVEMMVKMNAPGLRDGELRLWVDGRPVYAKTDMRWRLDASVQVGRAFDQVYRSKPFPKEDLYWVDNRVIATQYVGPMLPDGSKLEVWSHGTRWVTTGIDADSELARLGDTIWQSAVKRPTDVPATEGPAPAKELFRADFENGSVEGWGDNAQVAKPGAGGSAAALAVIDGRKAVGLWGLDVPVSASTTVSFAYRTEKVPSLQLMLWGTNAKDNFRFALPATSGEGWARMTVAASDFSVLGDAKSLVGDVIGGITFISDNQEAEGQRLWVDDIVIAAGAREGDAGAAPAGKAEAAAAPAAEKPSPVSEVKEPAMPEHKPADGELYFFVDPARRARRNAEDREQHNEYGLSIGAPWRDGGNLFINFPEHLEYETQGMSILRHWDRNPVLWVISPDGRQVTYRVESPHEKGVIVEAFARVALPEECPPGTKGVSVAMRITNGSEKTLAAVRPLLCVQYRGLTGFHQWTDNFKHSFIVIDGKLTALADLPTQQADSKFKGCVVKGCPQRDTRAERQGGLIEKDMDLALSVVESLDATRKLVIWWTPGKSMISNANIPCIHADPYIGALAPGKSAYAEGMVLFAEGDLAPVIQALKARDRTAF